MYPGDCDDAERARLLEEEAEWRDMRWAVFGIILVIVLAVAAAWYLFNVAVLA